MLVYNYNDHALFVCSKLLLLIFLLLLGCWVHCNDAKLSRSSSEEVLKSQPYVLFYARRRGRSPVLNRLSNDDDESPLDTKHMRT